MAPEKKKDEQAMDVDTAAPAVDKTAAANNLKDGNVVARYKDASQIVNSVLVLLLKEIQPGKKIYDLCQLGDQLLNDTVNKQFKNAKFQKGALPTCINVNNTVEHFSPSNEDTTELKWDDVVKVELALHLDGYVATVGHTLVLNEKAAEPITGPLADAICAAHMATELVIRKMKVGVVTSDLTSVVHQVASAFHSTPVEGTTISAHKKYVLGATPESFTLVPSPSTTVKLEANNVYSIFVPFSTVKAANATKTHPSLNPHLYARDVNNKYNLKLKTSKDCLKWIEGNASSVFPFPTRALQEIPRTRAGLPELVRNGVVSAVPIKVVSSGGNAKETAKVAGFRTMVLLTENGVERVTGTEFGHPFVKSEYSLTGELQTEFARNVKGKVKVNAEAADVLKTVKPAQDVVMG